MAMRVAQNVLELVGQTPIVRLKSFEAGGARIFAKFEAANPGGSVKDRIALNMLKEAEERGLLKGGVIVEPTSGNTGVGLAMVAAVKGWRCVLVTPEGLPPRRLSMLKAYGAEIIQTPFELGMKGAVDKAEAILHENPSWFSPMQFKNRANPAMHRKTTGPEIFRALKGDLDAFVAGIGTGGTLMGVGEFLKKKKPKVRLIAVEPASSPVLAGGMAGPHRIQGIGAGFVPAVYDAALVDELISVKDSEALECAARLAKEEGLLVGISSGANVFAASRVAQSLGKGRTVATLLCDRGELYLDEEGAFA
jgi:cysteine synthase A